MPDKPTLFELKEKAKWSHDTSECKAAITELSGYGQDAVPQLQEILNVTAYEDIRSACIDAIKAIQGSFTQEGSGPMVTGANIKETKTQKKEEQEESEERKELRLADLPP